MRSSRCLWCGDFIRLAVGVAIWWKLIMQSDAQCPAGSVTFEKISGSTIRGATQTLLFASDNPVPDTVTCVNQCRGTPGCQAFVVKYDEGACFQLSLTSEGRREAVITPLDRTNYFEKTCLRGPLCEAAWVFERMVGRELVGFDDRVFNSIANRFICEEMCLKEEAFQCRSGEYDYTLQQCRLSGEDRRSQPSSYRPSIGDVDYFENQCVRHSNEGCDYEQRPDSSVGFPDELRPASTFMQCQVYCDESRIFLCSSFSYESSTRQCRLSGDDTFSLGPNALMSSPGTLYFQRSGCLDIRLSCSPEGMYLVFHTLEPFEGRIYSVTEPNTCEVFGQHKTTTPFLLNLNDPGCGVVDEGSGRFTATIVIQHHPIIQRKGDRIIKLLCMFSPDNINKTVTNSYRVILGDEATATSIVNATAPTPNIRLRITNRNGEDVSLVHLGDELYLRIEIDDDSVFGIFARDLVARSAMHGVSVILIDSNGCPTNDNIFPPLERVPGTKAVQGRFEAFKFINDTVVQFQVNVRLCLEECEPANCGGNITSYGKRRRKRQTELTTTPNPIQLDYALQREIIVEGNKEGGLSEQSEEQEEYSSESQGWCVSKTIAVTSIIAAIILQIGLLASCISCIILNRRVTDPEDTVSTYTSHLTPFGGGRVGTFESFSRSR